MSTAPDRTASDLPVLLVVEDDEGLQRQLKWAYDGYQVISAVDRASAIEALRVHGPCVHHRRHFAPVAAQFPIAQGMSSSGSAFSIPPLLLHFSNCSACGCPGGCRALARISAGPCPSGC